MSGKPGARSGAEQPDDDGHGVYPSVGARRAVDRSPHGINDAKR